MSNSLINPPRRKPNFQLAAGTGIYDSPSGSEKLGANMISWLEILEMAKQPQRRPKTEGQWILPSSLNTRSLKSQLARGTFQLLWADIDGNPEQVPPSIGTMEQVIRDIFPDSQALIYTTRSATTTWPKYRVLIPLKTIVDARYYVALSKAFNNKLKNTIMEPDRASERPNQICFLPNEGSYYVSAFLESREFFDHSSWLAEIDTLRSAEPKREKSPPGQSVPDLETKPSAGGGNLIKTFNEQIAVETILRKAQYDEWQGVFRHPASQSGSFSASVLDGRVYSQSTSDPLYTGDTSNGAHDAFGAFTVLFHENNVNHALRDAGDNWVRIGHRSWNEAESDKLFNEDPEPFHRALPDETADGSTLEGMIARYSTRGKTSHMHALLTESSFVLEGIALQGQWTMLYASPNTGKTLLTLRLLIDRFNSSKLTPSSVVYVNADDNYRGAYEKASLADAYGFEQFVMDNFDFKLELLFEVIDVAIKEGKARHLVLILDTVKKFTDPNDKRRASDFGKRIRAFTLNGGTVIGLAHTNKNKDHEGNSIYEGTSDLMNDCDCAYVLESRNASTRGTGTYIVEFLNKKSRGDVAETISYEFLKQPSQSYQELLGTVRCLDADEATAIRIDEERQQRDLEDSQLIQEVLGFLGSCSPSKEELVEFIRGKTDISQKAAATFIDRRTGKNHLNGERWHYESAGRNKREYYALSPPDKDAPILF